jgi:hypothetical protein
LDPRPPLVSAGEALFSDDFATPPSWSQAVESARADRPGR